MRLKCVKNARNTFGGEHLLDDTEFNYGLQLQQWPLPYIINVTVTAQGGFTRELIQRERLQLQLLILVELTSNYSSGPFLN